MSNKTDEIKDNYTETLKLPKTEFPMRGKLPTMEPEILNEVFEKKRIYYKMLEQNKGKTPYVLHDGPPYANGEIHIGHALNKILKDTIVRYKHLKGFYTPYIPGYDTHGLPTEKKAIDKLKLKREEIPVNVFRDTCRAFATEYIDIQTEGFKRLGVLGDWENPYITYQPEMEAEQINVFGKMFLNGYIYKGLKPVYWCTDCETALAEAEIEYKDVTSHSVYVKFPIVETKNKELKDVSAVVWTTTPWTLPGNMAITVNPKYQYVILDLKRKKFDVELKQFGEEIVEEKILILKDHVEELTKKFNVLEYKETKIFKGEELENVKYRHPFMDRTSPILLGSDDTLPVDKESGTGLVHTAPGYGKEDYLMSQKYGLEIVVPVDAKGVQRDTAGMFNDMYYAKSNKEIIKWLGNNNYLIMEDKIFHSYPHCWRCKNPIIYRATDQWFASIDGFVKETLNEIKNVKWHPSWGEARMHDMIKERADWCISRQRTWGVPLPIFYCKDCNEPYITKESLEKVEKLFREYGSNIWYDKDVKFLMPENSKCKCGSTNFIKEKDIMDVWFDSGSTHRSVVKLRGLPKADLYLEGNDQYRGWFQSSLLTSVATTGEAPYKEVLTNGMVVDEKGKKMSKSIGNVISPLDISKRYGADILRLWVLSSDFVTDVTVSENLFKQLAENYRKMRNTARFILGNINEYDPNTDQVEYEDLEEVDKWALYRLSKLITSVDKYFNKFEFSKAFHEINQFCTVEMSTIYFDIIKDRLYCAEEKKRKTAQDTLYKILSALVRIFALIIPFTAEEIWKYLPKLEGENADSVMLESFPKIESKWNNLDINNDFKELLKIRAIVLKELEDARTNKVIGQSLEAKIKLSIPKKLKKIISKYSDFLADFFIVSEVEVKDGKEVKVKVERTKGLKCARCWKYENEKDFNKELELCKRCRKVLNKK